jgi:glycine betaine/proline transport system substrate-binding protein
MRPMTVLRRSVFILMALSIMRTSIGATEQPVLRLGVIEESFYEVVADIVAETLERQGYKVILSRGSHTDIYGAIGRGDIDLCVAFWLPDGHATQWKALGEKVAEVVTIYEGAHFFWGVPNYVPASEVSAISDLRKPAVAARMDHTIHGLAPDTTITFQSIAAIDKYQLREAGYRVVPGSFAAWTSSLQKAVAAGRWVVVPTWTPYWFVREYGLRPIADPQNLLGGMNRVVLAAHSPPGTAILKEADLAAIRSLRISLDDVVDMDVAINKNGLSPESAARSWLETHGAH